jgi:hypothetical protein
LLWAGKPAVIDRRYKSGYTKHMEQLGKLLIFTGIVLALVGGFFVFGSRLPLRLGRLPLDFHYQRENFHFYFPLGTSILISVILTIVFALIRGR